MKPRPLNDISIDLHAVRRMLGIDTWGMDIYRMKKRLSDLVQRVEALERAQPLGSGNDPHSPGFHQAVQDLNKTQQWLEKAPSPGEGRHEKVYFRPFSCFF